MGLMDEVLQADAEFVSDTDQFAETVTITTDTATTYTIPVIVDRNTPSPDPEYGRIGRVFDVQIARSSDSAKGLPSPPIKGYTVRLKDDPADSGTVVKEFLGVLTTDAGGWLVQFG